MATVSFANMDQAFDIRNNANIAFSSYDGYTYSYLTTGAHDWEFNGAGLVDNGTVLTAGTVNGVDLDLDNDSFLSPEISITGLSVAATSFGLNVGTADQQRDTFWEAALGGADTLNVTMANYTVDFQFAGDGAHVMDGSLHLGANDSFNDGGTALTGFSFFTGDYMDVTDGVAVGGDDTFTVGAYILMGDFRVVSGGSGVGGDDVLTPARLVDTTAGGSIYMMGDVDGVNSGLLNAGADLIDLRSTDVSGLTTDTPVLVGDAYSVGSGGALIAGSDTIHGSSHADRIYGDYQANSGYVEGAKDRLFGYAGNDTILGNEGRDQLYGGDNDDNLDGGLDGDIIDGGAGNDSLTGDTGNDSMTGGDGNDTAIGGSGADTINGDVGDDIADASAGADVMNGGTGKDNYFGGAGNDSMSGDAGNDTLSGGDNNDTMLGGAGFDVLLGGNNEDYLDGGTSNDHLYGNAGVDTFAFSTGSGVDTVHDMVAGAGAGDFIRLQGFGAAFDTFAEVLAAATDNGADTTIDFGGGNMLVLLNVVVGDLNADDFIFG